MNEVITYLSQHKLELSAAFFGLLYVVLAAKENYLCWFAGIMNVSIYIVIFYQQKIFANMSLQVIYLIISFYGLYAWLSKKKGQQAFISKMDSSYRYFMVILFILLTGTAYITLQNSDTTLLTLDALTSAAGIIATWMQARKFIENWLIWIPTDLTIMVMFILEEMYVSAALFLIYTIIAIIAYRKWAKALKHKELAQS